ncbi:MAG TPA: aminotransferase class V-fold PLP-dependent enzyme [Candidatus Paceibacterota bacterium]|nr:aminotransferase class V-fold PLP-dependent enzyme [Candidatus Paceibacterota bacterium]
MIDEAYIKDQFPQLFGRPEVIFFDSASTSQKPRMVIAAIDNYLKGIVANPDRGTYAQAIKAAGIVDTTRKRVKEFINAYDVSEVVFTSGATESLNLIPLIWGFGNLRDGDEILLCKDDHQSSVLPWLHLRDILQKSNITIRLIFYELDPRTGTIPLETIGSMINPKTRLVCATHIHNVYGTLSDMRGLRKLIGDQVLVSLDASQSVGHTPIDVQNLCVDFLAFGGHKMFATEGIGVLWVNHRLHNTIKPVKVGSNPRAGSEKTLPNLLEVGTQNIFGLVGLGAAIEFIENIGIKNIHDYLGSLTEYLLIGLKKIPQVEFLPGPAYTKDLSGYGIISFRITGVSSTEVGFILDEKQICVRTGSHCTTEGRFVDDSIRVSLHVYNTKAEIDRFISIVKEISDTV